jgi:hypothetical protein
MNFQHNLRLLLLLQKQVIMNKSTILLGKSQDWVSSEYILFSMKQPICYYHGWNELILKTASQEEKQNSEVGENTFLSLSPFFSLTKYFSKLSLHKCVVLSHHIGPKPCELTLGEAFLKLQLCNFIMTSNL